MKYISFYFKGNKPFGEFHITEIFHLWNSGVMTHRLGTNSLLTNTLSSGNSAWHLSLTGLACCWYDTGYNQRRHRVFLFSVSSVLHDHFSKTPKILCLYKSSSTLWPEPRKWNCSSQVQITQVVYYVSAPRPPLGISIPDKPVLSQKKAFIFLKGERGVVRATGGHKVAYFISVDKGFSQL